MAEDDKRSKEKLEKSKRLVVAAAGVMVVQRRRWIGMELGLLMMGAESPVGRG